MTSIKRRTGWETGQVSENPSKSTKIIDKPEIHALAVQGQNCCLFYVKHSIPVEGVFLWSVNGC